MSFIYTSWFQRLLSIIAILAVLTGLAGAGLIVGFYMGMPLDWVKPTDAPVGAVFVGVMVLGAGTAQLLKMLYHCSVCKRPIYGRSGFVLAWRALHTALTGEAPCRDCAKNKNADKSAG